MAAVDVTRELNGLSLGAFKPYFARLDPPDPSGLAGVYRAEFVGPAWLRKTAAPGLALTGLGGWWGKVFEAEARAWNLVRRAGSLSRVLPMTVEARASLVDGRAGVTLAYGSSAPFPWRHVVDELRRIDDTTLLGITLVVIGPLRDLPLPFLLWYHGTSI